MVSKPASEMEEKGTHQKGSGSTCPQRTSGNLFRRANTSGRVTAQGARTTAEKVAQEFGTTTEKVGCQRSSR